MIPLIAAVVSSVIALTSAVLTILYKRKVDRIARAEELKQRYSNPLLKSAEELHNKLNDVIRNHSRVLGYLKNLRERIANTQTLNSVLSSGTTLYVFHLLYMFARYFANIEEIKRGFGVLQLETPKQTRAMHRRLRQTVAVFFSNRLHNGIETQSPHLIYQGKILEGMQVMMAEAMLVSINGTNMPMGFTMFCQELTQNQEFRDRFFPLVDLLNNLTVVVDVNDGQGSVDFRWIKLVFCSFFLSRLVKAIDTADAITLLPETEEYTEQLLQRNSTLRTNLQLFRKGYPDP